MDREILFKAKRKNWHDLPKEEWWVEGMPSYDVNGNLTEMEVYRGFAQCEIIEIETETICRCSGMTDKNRKMIFENDILRGHGNDKELCKVVLGGFYVIDVETLEKIEYVKSWHTTVIPTDTLSKCVPFCLDMPLTDHYIKRGEYEVIGNAIDNLELLEGANHGT